MIDHREQMHVGLVGHHPSPGGDLEPARVHQVAQRLLLAGVRLLPPAVQKRDLRPDKGQIVVLLQLRHHVAHDLTRGDVEVAFEGL